MFRGFSGHQRVAPLAERRVVAQLHEALATLPAPWIVLANRRASGADGPPWVRFLALHPAKGIALVDTTAAEAAKAPLEDFLARTGFPALQPGALPIVPVAIGPDEVTAVAEILERVFVQGQPAIGNPNWCDAVVELLLAVPDLMLSPLHRGVRQPVARAPQPQAEPSFRPSPQPARAEPSRPSANAAPRAPTPPDTESEAVRLVPRRVARPAESRPQSEPSPSPSRATTRQPHTPDVPQFLLQGLQDDEPHLALEAGEPIDPSRQARTSRSRRDPTFGAGPGHADAAWRRPRASRRRSAFLPIAAGLLLVAAGAVALRYHESSSSLTANTAAQSSPPSPTASLTPPTMPSPLPTVSPNSAPTPAATMPAPSPPPAPPVHAAATPQAPTAPSVKKADVDLPRDMLQPQIVSAPPPAPPPLPAAKRAPQPVRTATTKPHPTPPAPADTDLPAAIAAVLHPGAAPPPAASEPTTAAPSSATATAPAPAATGGEVTVNGVSYVNGQQPHALGTLGSAPPSAPPPAAVASNVSPPAAVTPPGEVVISRAPASSPATSSGSNNDSDSGATASGPPTTLQVTPLPGSSNP
ncbi:MAG TPA: hypothetical protein VJS41_11060 [Stellaceae bacterium]|nr:hypothetical protein [Stellaceae bacterium]